MAANPIYQFYAELTAYEPTMWRRFQVTNNVTMARLGYILMTLFDMEANQLFCFDVPFSENVRRRTGGIPEKAATIELFKRPADSTVLHFELLDNKGSPSCGEHTLEASGFRLKYAADCVGDELSFTYDFHGRWLVRLVLEKILTDRVLPAKELPRVLQGEGRGIVEDVGGAENLMAVRRIFEKKSGLKYRELCEWLGATELDLVTFDLDDMNYRLKRVPRIYREMYEHDYRVSKHSLAILDREYKTS